MRQRRKGSCFNAIAIILALLVLGVSPASAQITAERMGFVGPVREVVTSIYDAPVEEFGEWSDGNPSRQETIRFDPQGFRTEYFWTQTHDDSYTNGSITIDVLPDGNERYDEYRDGELYQYNMNEREEGRTVRIDYYSPDGSLVGRYLYEYDSAGNRTKFRGYGEDGIAVFASDYFFNEAGEQTSVIRFNSDGTESSRTFFRYDQRGRLTRSWTVYPSDSRLARLSLFSYREGGTINSPCSGESVQVRVVQEEFQYYIPVGEDPEVYSPTPEQEAVYEYPNVAAEFSDHGKLGVLLQVHLLPVIWEICAFCGEYCYEFDARGNMTLEMRGELTERFGEIEFVPHHIKRSRFEYY